jgi:hypothetical protein
MKSLKTSEFGMCPIAEKSIDSLYYLLSGVPFSSQVPCLQHRFKDQQPDAPRGSQY